MYDLQEGPAIGGAHHALGADHGRDGSAGVEPVINDQVAFVVDREHTVPAHAHSNSVRAGAGWRLNFFQTSALGVVVNAMHLGTGADIADDVDCAPSQLALAIGQPARGYTERPGVAQYIVILDPTKAILVSGIGPIGDIEEARGLSCGFDAALFPRKL